MKSSRQLSDRVKPGPAGALDRTSTKLRRGVSRARDEDRLERIRHPEIIPLELSDLWAGGAAEWRTIQARGTVFALRQVIETLQPRGGSRVNRSIPPAVRNYEALFVTGGQVKNETLRAELSGLPSRVIFGKELVFAGVRGGFEWLKDRGLRGWVADWGQSQLKLAARGHRWTFPRALSRLRVAGKVSALELPAQRRRLREFIALRLQMAMADSARRPGALVFALPTRVAADGTPVGSSYAGMGGDRMLLPDALAMAGLPGLPLFVLNDAELAALSARFDSRLARFRNVLVLTLGFGIGAALLHRSNRSRRLF